MTRNEFLLRLLYRLVLVSLVRNLQLGVTCLSLWGSNKMLLALDFEQNAFCRLNTNKTGVNFDSRFSVVSLLLSGTICYVFLLVFIEIYFKKDCKTLSKMYLCIKPSKSWEGGGFRENLLNGCELENGNCCGSEESSERYPDG